MPRQVQRYKVIRCKTCGKVIKRFDRTKYTNKHVPKEKILDAIRDHYKKHHPRKFKQFAKKAVKTKRKRYGAKMRNHAKWKRRRQKMARKRRKRRKPKGKGWVWNPKIKRWVKRKKRGRGFIIA